MASVCQFQRKYSLDEKKYPVWDKNSSATTRAPTKQVILTKLVNFLDSQFVYPEIEVLAHRVYLDIKWDDKLFCEVGSTVQI